MSSVEVKITKNFEPLIRLRKGLSKPIGVKVGVLGNNNSRTDGGVMGNAEIGLIQEFGSETNNIPPRSFLRMPLETQGERLEAAMQKGSIAQNIVDGNMVAAFRGIGIIAENIIQEAFTSGGFGTWAPNAPSTVAKKGSDKPLIDTAQLHRSITSKVVQGK